MKSDYWSTIITFLKIISPWYFPIELYWWVMWYLYTWLFMLCHTVYWLLMLYIFITNSFPDFYRLQSRFSWLCKVSYVIMTKVFASLCLCLSKRPPYLIANTTLFKTSHRYFFLRFPVSIYWWRLILVNFFRVYSGKYSSVRLEHALNYYFSIRLGKIFVCMHLNTSNCNFLYRVPN